jgi:MFS family permease
MRNPVRRKFLFAAACAGLAIFGASLALLGTLFGFPGMQQRLHLDMMREGELSALLMFGLWIATFVSGPVIDRYGHKAIFAVCAFLAAAGFLPFAWTGSFLMCAAAALLVGASGGGLNTSTNAVVSELYPEKRGTMLNILGVFLGVGGVTVPLLASHVSPQTAILAVVAFALACGLWYLSLRFPPAREAHGFSLGAAARVLAYPGVLLLSLLLLFESGNEQAMSAFTSTWMEAAGATARSAALIFAAYQICLAAGRLLAVVLLERLSKRGVVLLGGMGSFAGTGILFLRHDAPGAAAGALLTGISLAVVYPTALAMAGDRYQRFSGTVFGAIFAIALFGAVASPPAVGALGTRGGAHAGTIVPVVGTAMVTLLALVVIWKERRERAKAAVSAQPRPIPNVLGGPPQPRH